MKSLITSLICLFLFSCKIVLGCGIPDKSKSDKTVIKTFNIPLRTISSVNNIDLFCGGNPDSSLEAKLGNLLLQNKENLIISIPIVVNNSSKNPFGDGQTNAKLSLGSSWKENGFIVVGLHPKSSPGKNQYLFHDALKVTNYKEIFLNDGWIEVKPEGWQDSFYFNFDSATLNVDEFKNGIPEKFRRFSQNRIAPNPENISNINSFKSLKEKRFGEGYNQEPWSDTNVHGRFPEGGSEIKTAIGGVLTWGIVNPNFGSFKHLYTCFSPRDIAAEKNQKVPSGAGWHRIGDAAESLLNTLEVNSIPVGIARTHHKSSSAYGLTETITASWLGRNQVLVTKRGEFHWYLNPYTSPVCTEVWVHNCEPNLSNNWGFNCAWK